MATTDSRHHRMRSTSASKTNVPSPPMHEAIMNGDLKKLQQLLKSGDVQLHPVTRETPLHMAARSGAIECLRWLLDNGINSPLDKDRDGSTPGHYCAVYGQLEALKVTGAIFISWALSVFWEKYVNNTFLTLLPG